MTLKEDLLYNLVLEKEKLKMKFKEDIVSEKFRDINKINNKVRNIKNFL